MWRSFLSLLSRCSDRSSNYRNGVDSTGISFYGLDYVSDSSVTFINNQLTYMSEYKIHQNDETHMSTQAIKSRSSVMNQYA